MALGSDGVLHRWQVSNGREETAELAELGASAPIDFSPRGGYLIATTDDGELHCGMWPRKKQLHLLEDSQREYALVAISDDDRWVAGVQKELPDHIDLWRADTGRYLGVLRAAGGPKHSLRFSNTGDQLLVFDDEGQGVVLNVPSGVGRAAISGREAQDRRADHDRTRPGGHAVCRRRSDQHRSAPRHRRRPRIWPAAWLANEPCLRPLPRRKPPNRPNRVSQHPVNPPPAPRHPANRQTANRQTVNQQPANQRLANRVPPLPRLRRQR